MTPQTLLALEDRLCDIETRLKDALGYDAATPPVPRAVLAAVWPDPAWRARPGLDLPSLAELWNRTDAEMGALLKGSALRRTKVAGLRRNLAVAIGNGGDETALTALTVVRDDQPSAADPVVRDHIDWAARKRRGSDNRVE